MGGRKAGFRKKKKINFFLVILFDSSVLKPLLILSDQT